MRLYLTLILLLQISISSTNCLLASQSDLNESEVQITGKFVLDDSWSSEVFLSHIPTFNQRFQISNQMIIARTEMDSLGNFNMTIDFLPEQFHLYRLHVVKKGDSPASLIIGGQNENHFFIVLNKQSNLHLQNDTPLPPFDDVFADGGKASQSFLKFSKLQKDFERQAALSNASVRKLMNDQFMADLLAVADTSELIMTSLYAIYLHQNMSGWANDKYAGYISRWNDSSNPYIEDFITKQQQDSKGTVYFVALIMLIIGIVIFTWLSSGKSNKQDLLEELSIQERKVFVLLKEGKTNQEISDEYNIAVSTVKTHVSNIYSKLKISSRKEAMNFRHD